MEAEPYCLSNIFENQGKHITEQLNLAIYRWCMQNIAVNNETDLKPKKLPKDMNSRCDVEIIIG